MGQITGKDNNRVPTVKECNDAYGGNYMTESEVAEAISDATANFLTSSDFQMSFGVAEEVYHTVWLYRGSDGKFKPNGSCYKDNDGYRLHLHIQWHSDGTASYEHIYLRPDGYTIEANWVE